MKKILLLILSLLLTLTLLVACDESNVPSDDTTGTEAATEAPDATEPEIELPTEAPTEMLTETPTEIPTEAPTEKPTEVPTEADTDAPENDETTAEEEDPLTDIHDVMAAIITQNDLGGLTNYRVKTDMDLEFAVSIFGFTTKVNLTGGVSFVQASADAMAVEMQIPTQAPYSLTYVNGVLYVVTADGKYKCPLNEGEQDMVWSELWGGLLSFEDASDSLVKDEIVISILSSLLETMEVTALFRDTKVELDPNTEMTTVTLYGISEKIRAALDGTLDAMAQDATLPDTESTTAESINFLVSLLKSVDLSDMTVTLTADKDMLLQSYTVSAPVNMDGFSDIVGDLELIPGLGTGADMPMDATLTLSSVIERGDQTVAAPEDADTYEETDWMTLLGQSVGQLPEIGDMIPPSEESKG